MNKNKKVVVVESPSKAKTINKYLGSDFSVVASYGHIRDLPSKNGSVNPEDGFSMIWEMDERGKKSVEGIRKELKGATELYLATDPDREGEAISWHVQNALDKDLKNIHVQRIVFNEITKQAVQNALETPREISMPLVEAYLARRALDYLFGFTLSPLLWRKLPGARSAGRVQSVALRLIVDREEEIERFVTQEYWSIHGEFSVESGAFSAKLSHFEGEKLGKFSIRDELEAKKICDCLQGKFFTISEIEKKQVRRHPTPPFITSTLQQEAARKLGFGASRTMQLAQKLYEGIEIHGETTGLITYMRTDSTNLSQEAIKDIRSFVTKTFGKDYIPAKPRDYKNKVKNAQEAHEGIRPTNVEWPPQFLSSFLEKDQARLYELIWKRALASQMESAVFDQVTVQIKNEEQKAVFKATGSTLVFDGFLKLYQEDKDEPDEEKDGDKTLPVFKQGEDAQLHKLLPNQHFTQPPPRYTEASLVKKLEEQGIGRPSTYASLLQVLQDRSYVRLDKKQFIPQDYGRLVTSFLVHFFSQYVQYNFTAHMEELLDNISSGQASWKKVLEEFWLDFSKNVEDTAPLRLTEVINTLEQDLNHYLFNNASEEERACPTCKEGKVGLRLGKFGAFIGCSRYPDCKYTRSLSGEETQAPEKEQEALEVGRDPQTNILIKLKKGPYGYYFEWEGEVDGKKKPKRVSLPSGLSPDQGDLSLALVLDRLPLPVGLHPETGEPIQVGSGRFGPYLKYQHKFVSIPKSMQRFWEITLDESVSILDKKKQNLKKSSLKKKN